MTYRVINNKKYGTVSLLFTANDNVIIAGNSTSSNVAISDEILSGGVITQIWFGSPSGNAAYWQIKRGANTILIADSTSYMDFRGTGASLTIDNSANLTANLVGSTSGTLIVELKKIPAANGFPTL